MTRLHREPDWSFHEDALRAARAALGRGVGRKVAVVIPTGGGKTRVAVRILLTMLAAAAPGSRVVWVTHRHTLRRQAREALHQLVSDRVPGLPPNAGELLTRVEFVMVSELSGALRHTGPDPVLVVVDEAHHAAAPSYQPLFAFPRPLSALFLTATPNRRDGLPLGIDEIAYSITFRELVDRGVVLDPVFEQFPVSDFEWTREDVTRLADHVVSRSGLDYQKVLVIAPTVEKVETFHRALRDAHARHPGHLLAEDDIGYVHSRGNPDDIDADEYVLAFTRKPRGILVSAMMLLEGFDDPSIDTVVITYPSQSMTVLMQAVGRCVRWAPRKSAAHVLQAHNSALAYHYDHGWLYQDLSDALRPRTSEQTFRTNEELLSEVAELLDARRVPASARARILDDLRAGGVTRRCRVLLSGLPYYGPVDRFDEDAAWSALLETEGNAHTLRSVFNDYCDADCAPTEVAFLAHHPNAPPRTDAAGWSAYVQLLAAMRCAHDEICRDNVEPTGNRPFRAHHATTWLECVTFTQASLLPPELEEFLRDAHNAHDLASTYLLDPARWVRAMKIPLPGGGTFAFLLEPHQAEWVDTWRASLEAELTQVRGLDRLAVAERKLRTLRSVPVPVDLAREVMRAAEATAPRPPTQLPESPPSR